MIACQMIANVFMYIWNVLQSATCKALLSIYLVWIFYIFVELSHRGHIRFANIFVTRQNIFFISYFHSFKFSNINIFIYICIFLCIIVYIFIFLEFYIFIFLYFYILTISKSVLVYALHSVEYVLGLARFRVFVPNIYIFIYLYFYIFIS